MGRHCTLPAQATAKAAFTEANGEALDPSAVVSLPRDGSTSSTAAGGAQSRLSNAHFDTLHAASQLPSPSMWRLQPLGRSGSAENTVHLEVYDQRRVVAGMDAWNR